MKARIAVKKVKPAIEPIAVKAEDQSSAEVVAIEAADDDRGDVIDDILNALEKVLHRLDEIDVQLAAGNRGDTAV